MVAPSFEQIALSTPIGAASTPRGAASTPRGAASTPRGSFASASPELAAKLTKQFERIEGQGSPNIQNSSAHHVLLDDDNASEDHTGFLDEADDTDHRDGDGTDSEAEPLDYLMMDVAARLPDHEATELMDKIRRFERRQSRLEEELRSRRASDRMQSRSPDTRSPQKTGADVTSAAGKSGDESGGDPSTYSSRACSRGDSTDRRSEAASGSTSASKEGAAAFGSAATAYAQTQSNASRFSSRSLFLALGVLVVAVMISVFRLVSAFESALPAAGQASVPTIVALSRSIVGSSSGKLPVAEQEVPSVAEVASELEALASLSQKPLAIAESNDLLDTPESRAVVRARELAAEQTKTQEVRRAVEAAAQRLVASSSPQAHAPSAALASSDPAVRRAALRERVKEMKDRNMRMPWEVSSNSP